MRKSSSCWLPSVATTVTLAMRPGAERGGILVRIPPDDDHGDGMRVTLTGASGLIGSRLVKALRARGDDVTVLSRDPARATQTLGVPAERWEPLEGRAPAHAFAG